MNTREGDAVIEKNVRLVDCRSKNIEMKNISLEVNILTDISQTKVNSKL